MVRSQSILAKGLVCIDAKKSEISDGGLSILKEHGVAKILNLRIWVPALVVLCGAGYFAFHLMEKKSNSAIQAPVLQSPKSDSEAVANSEPVAASLRPSHKRPVARGATNAEVSIGLLAPATPSILWLNPGEKIRFSWSSTGPAHFELRVARDQEFRDLVFSKQTHKRSLDVVLSERETLFWQVIQIDGPNRNASNGDSKVALAQISIHDNSAHPHLLTPEFKAEFSYDADVEMKKPKGKILDFTWQDSSPVDGYEIQVSRDPGFSRGVIQEKTELNSLTLGPFAKGTYYWRARGLHLSRRNPPWSKSRDFTIQEVPAPTATPAPSPPREQAAAVDDDPSMEDLVLSTGYEFTNLQAQDSGGEANVASDQVVAFGVKWMQHWSEKWATFFDFGLHLLSFRSAEGPGKTVTGLSQTEREISAGIQNQIDSKTSIKFLASYGDRLFLHGVDSITEAINLVPIVSVSTDLQRKFFESHHSALGADLRLTYLNGASSPVGYTVKTGYEGSVGIFMEHDFKDGRFMNLAFGYQQRQQDTSEVQFVQSEVFTSLTFSFPFWADDRRRRHN
jgi:hypothetical protein